MNSMKLAAMAIGVMVLAACGPTAQQLATQDDQKCVSLGFERGTENYGMCRLQAEQIRIAEYQARVSAYRASIAGSRNARNIYGAP